MVYNRIIKTRRKKKKTIMRMTERPRCRARSEAVGVESGSLPSVQ